MNRELTFANAIHEALHQALDQNENVICYGLGVDDPRGVFGTTIGLQNKFGKDRVFDTPTSENAMTGIGIGASLNGLRPVMTHQRLDFFLLAMDQLVNNAAKWHYMFGGQMNVPITIRLIMGRGWGQGPTHSQNLQAWFAHIPGLKVVMPTFADDAKGLLLSAIFDDNPVVFLEHRWLYGQKSYVPENFYYVPIGQGKLVTEGDALTIVAMSYMTIEALKACKYLEKNNIHCDLIDLRTIKPIDWGLIFKSLSKTRVLLVLDTGHATCSVASEIIATVAMESGLSLKYPPVRMALPDSPTPTSYALTKDFYVRASDIITKVYQILKLPLPKDEYQLDDLQHDIPDSKFTGPF